MKKININLEPIKVFAEGATTIIGLGLLACASLYCAVVSEGSNGSRTTYCAGYSGAVDAIMKSEMSSYYKQEAIRALRRDGDDEYYRAISYIVNDSNTSSYYVVEMINGLNNK